MQPLKKQFCKLYRMCSLGIKSCYNLVDIDYKGCNINAFKAQSPLRSQMPFHNGK